MKNYKMLVPVVVVFLFLISFYSLYSGRSAEMKEYQTELTAARDLREQGIIGDAEEKYFRCLEIAPSAELSREIGEFYMDFMRWDDAIEWGEQLLAEYPRFLGGYDFMMSSYDNMGDYIECFRLADMMQEKKLTTPITDEILQKIRYYYYFDGEFEGAGTFSEGRCPVKIRDLWAYVDNTGSLVCDLLYTEAGPYSEGLAPVVDTKGDAYFVDGNGAKKHVVLNVDHVKKLGYVAYGIFPLYNGRTWSFYNLDHEHVFGEYEEVSSVGNYVAAVKEKGKWHLVDQTGKALGTAAYENVIQDAKTIVYRNERLFVSDGKKVSMIDIAGNVIASYDDARLFLDTTLAAVKKDGKWGFADKDGNMVIKPQFEDAESFCEGLAPVRSHGKWGYIDLTGKMVIAPAFDEAREMTHSGCTCVLEDDSWKVLKLYQYNH